MLEDLIVTKNPTGAGTPVRIKHSTGNNPNFSYGRFSPRIGPKTKGRGAGIVDFSVVDNLRSLEETSAASGDASEWPQIHCQGILDLPHTERSKGTYEADRGFFEESYTITTLSATTTLSSVKIASVLGMRTMAVLVDEDVDEYFFRFPTEDAPGLIIPPEVTDFCNSEGIVDYLSSFIDIVRNHFPSLQGTPEVALIDDPEIDDRWIEVRIRLRGGIDEILDQYDNFVDKCISSIPWPQSDRFRLSYNVS